MKVLIACEFSGCVRTEFEKRGHDAWSCDFLASERTGSHLQCDVREVLDRGWDLMIAHPPCTHLCVSGARWFPEKLAEQRDALDFVRTLLNAPIEKIALENPVGIISTRIRKPDQTIQPWQFLEFENKKTCLWLKNLPKLKPTGITPFIMRDHSVHYESPGPGRWKNRSRFWQGVAEAMAQQWG